MADPIGFTADALSAATEAVDKASDRFFGVVRAVNVDGSLTVESGIGYRTSMRSLSSYSPRTVGDTVLCMVTQMGPIVQGKIGPPQSARNFVLSDSSAPGGQGWEETVSGQIWAKSDGSQWEKRTVASTPPSGGGVSQQAGALVTYRSNNISQTGVAEQGDYSGGGMQTGLAAFGSWAGLSGHTCNGGTLTIHRRASGHGFTWGPVAAYAYAALASGTPNTPTPTLIGNPVGVVAALNETQSVAIPAAWGQPFCAGTANAVMFYSGNAQDNIEIDNVILTVTY